MGQLREPIDAHPDADGIGANVDSLTCDLCDCGLAARKIRPNGTGFRAECPLDRRRDVDLSEDDLRVYSIDAASLASAISITAGFSAGRLNSRGLGVASRSKTGRGKSTVPIFLLVPQVKLAKRLDLARDAERALAALPGMIVANWVSERV